MVDYLVQLNPQRKIDRLGMARLKHPLQAMIYRGRRFGKGSVKFSTDDQTLLVTDFDGTRGDLAKFVEKLASQSAKHDPNIPIAPEINRVEESTKYEADAVEASEEFEALQGTLDLYLQALDEAEQQTHWLTTEAERLEGVRTQESAFRTEISDLQKAKTDIAKQLEDAKQVLGNTKKAFDTIQDGYTRLKKNNAILNKDKADLEQRLEQNAQRFVATDPTEIRINEVSESASEIREYEKKLTEQGVENPEEVIRVAGKSLAEFVNSELAKEFKSDEQVRSSANSTAFEETDFYKASSKTYETSAKMLKFFTLDSSILPESVKAIYDTELQKRTEYEAAVGQFESEREKISTARKSAGEIAAAIKDYEKAKLLLPIVTNPPEVRMHIISIKDHEEIYIPTGEEHSVLSESSIKELLPAGATVNAGPNYLAVSLEKGECAGVADAIRSKVRPVFTNVKITLEGEL